MELLLACLLWCVPPNEPKIHPIAVVCKTLQHVMAIAEHVRKVGPHQSQNEALAQLGIRKGASQPCRPLQLSELQRSTRLTLVQHMGVVETQPNILATVALFRLGRFGRPARYILVQGHRTSGQGI